MATSSARDRARADTAADRKRRRLEDATADREARAARGELTDDELDWEESGKVWAERRKAEARDAERAARDMYEAGRRDATRDARQKRAPAGGSARSTSSTRATKARRTARTARRGVRRVATAPSTAARTGSFESLVLATIAVAVLYVFLQNAQRLAGFLGGFGTALEWLKDPHTTIKFKE